MSGAVAVPLVAALLTVGGLGLIPLLGLAGSRSELVRRAGLAPLLGMAGAGIAGALLATVGARLGLAGLVALTAVVAWGGVRRLVRLGPPCEERPRTRRRAEVVPTVLAVGLLGLVAVASLRTYLVLPLAEYDGWAMWGMKARALAELGSADPNVFASDAYARLHLEYPLLLPALHAFPVQATDEFTSNTVVLSCLALGAAGLLAIWALLHELVRPWLLLPFVAAIAAMPAFAFQLGTGYADVPLALFVAAGLTAAARWLVEPKAGWLAAATVFLAAGVLTKDEGLLFASAVLIPLAFAATGRRRAVVAAALVVAALYAPWRAYVSVNGLEAPHYDLSSSFDLPWIAGRLDRVPTAASGLLEQALDPGQFGWLLLLAAFAIVGAWSLGAHRLGILSGGFVTLSLAGLVWIYVLTPYELASYLPTNAHRVVMSVVVATGALAPLLVEESARRLAGDGHVGTHR